MSQSPLVYYTNCVNWPAKRVDALITMIEDALDITRATFLRHVDRQQLREQERGFGYAQHPQAGLTMAKDWHVSYHRSKLAGERVYFFKHSGIEYVYVPPELLQRLADGDG